MGKVILWDYYRDVLVPANGAVSALRRAGLPIHLSRLRETKRAWAREVERLEQYVEGEAAARGVVVKFSPRHALGPKALQDLLYSPQGLGFTIRKWTAPSVSYPRGQPSTDDEALLPYASIKNPKPDDHPVVTALLKIRSLNKGMSTYLENFERTVRGDGACHPKFNWALRTSRLSAEDPPVHQIPERSDQVVAEGVKGCIIPRVQPALVREDWNPHKHGSCFRWDIVGAEACIRGAMLPVLFCSRPDPVLWEYLRKGRDVHSKTASLIYGVPEGTYKKGSYQRDQVGKQVFFAKIFGAAWPTLQSQVWTEARIWLPDLEARRISEAFEAGYPGLTELYEWDKDCLGRQGYCEDGYGRRRWIGLPDGVRYLGRLNGRSRWEVQGRTEEERKTRWADLNHRFHVAANSPTQSMNATDALWMLALLYYGEYVELRVPPMWEGRGVAFPEAKGWQLHDGPGPGGKPFRAWHINSVHDSGWGDCAPGYLEAVAKVVYRRCTALPFDWRLKADVPYRVELTVGPDLGALQPYNQVAKVFGLESLPEV